MAVASGSSLPGGAAKFINEVVLPAEAALPAGAACVGRLISDGRWRDAIFWCWESECLRRWDFRYWHLTDIAATLSPV